MQCNKALELNEALNTMIGLLETEHQAIRKRDADQLTQVTLEKDKLAKQLEILGHTLIRELRITPDTQATSRSLKLVAAHCSQHPTLAESLKKNSEKVQTLNNRNGILLQSMMLINEQSLNILTGRPSRVMTYQASGRLRPEQTTSSIPLASV